MRIETEDLGFGYPRKAVGRHVGLSVGPGEVMCLLGPNGCGKTTLFKTMLGLLPAQAGRVVIGGDDLARLSRRELALRIAYVPQAQIAVFPFTVLDIVLMGRTARIGDFATPGARDREIAFAALGALGIAALAEAEYTRISGGQRQLALIARALAQDTPLLVMDEPTASLDFGNQALVLRHVRELARTGLGIVLSTHDPDHALACATRVAVLHDGRLLAQGLPREVLTGDLMGEVYGVPVRIVTLDDGRTVCLSDLG
jgi:iron complex transport system ATP-binding protein